MKNTKIFKKGFTLLELLVVVAIIGILSAVVVVALRSSRDEGDDAAVKSNLNTLATQAELFYSDHNSFSPGGEKLGPTNCKDLFDYKNVFAMDKIVSDSLFEAQKRGSGVFQCAVTPSNWSVAVGLKVKVNTSWCVGAGGVSKLVNYTPENAIDKITRSCK